MILTITILLFFIAIFAGTIAVYTWYAAVKASPNYQLKRRLGKLALIDDEKLPSDLTRELLGEMKPLDKFLLRSSLYRRFDRFIDTTGLQIDPKIVILFIIITGICFFILGISLNRGIVVSILLTLIAIGSIFIYLSFKKHAQLITFTEQLPDALDMVARSLRAGHAMQSAIQLVGNEMSEPVSGLFRVTYEEQQLGLPMRDSLALMLERMPSVDLRLFVTAVNIHREVGGNLAETLERLANTIRDRLRVKRQVRVYSAQGRLSGYILVALPIVMAIMLYSIAPDYLEEFIKVDEGKYAVAIAVIAQVIGFIIIKRLINIRI
jgi:tight adherence protein B